MVNLTKHERRVVLAIFVALLCRASGFAELEEKRNDLHQGRIHAIAVEGAKDGESVYEYSKHEHHTTCILYRRTMLRMYVPDVVHISVMLFVLGSLGKRTAHETYAGKHKGGDAGRMYARNKRQQPNAGSNVAQLSDDFVGVLDQGQGQHRNGDRYRFVTLSGRGQFEWVRMDRYRRKSKRTTSINRNTYCPFRVRPIGGNNLFKVYVNETQEVDSRAYVELLRSVDGDTIKPLGRQGVFQVIPTRVNVSSPCPDCEFHFDVVAVKQFCRFLVIRGSPPKELNATDKQTLYNGGGALQERDAVSGSLSGKPPSVKDEHEPLRDPYRARLSVRSPNEKRDSARRSSTHRINIRQVAPTGPLQFPRIMSARFHIGDRLLDKISQTAQQDDPVWQPWGPWGACSATCGVGGVRTRTRVCNSKTGRCHGIASQQQTCARLPSCFGKHVTFRHVCRGSN